MVMAKKAWQTGLSRASELAVLIWGGPAVLYVFGFDRTAVVLSDLYLVDPDPIEGQEGPEHGVRLEVRRLSAGELKGAFTRPGPSRSAS